LKELPSDFFSSEEYEGNFITACMNEFINFCNWYGTDAVKARVKKLEAMLLADFGFKCCLSEESKL